MFFREIVYIHFLCPNIEHHDAKYLQETAAVQTSTFQLTH
nr:MAG TPA: hypothetical protein [Caudoviricetes sp.]